MQTPVHPNGVVDRVKRTGRHLADRLVQPYVDQAVARLAPGPGDHGSDEVAKEPPTLLPTFTELHATLHEGRSLALADMPSGATTLLSAGANGRWYFDWFDTEYGPVDRHIGVEAYMPEPEGLPAHVHWVDADLAGPDGVSAVDSGSVDLVFSGQNMEHLWPTQLVAFLVESNRILTPGGWLVVDSPNRDITAAFGWSMGEHTLEFTPGEASELLGLAGFEVERMKGIWLCRNRDGLLPLEPDPAGDGPGTTLRRLILDRDRPSDSFIWWAEARKASTPDPKALAARIEEIYLEAWAERVARLSPHDGTPGALADGRPGSSLDVGRQGYVLLGPWMAVPPGTFDFTVEVIWDGAAASGGTVARLEVVAGDDLLATTDVIVSAASGLERVTATVCFDTLHFAVHVRLFATGGARVSAPLDLVIRPEPWR